MKKSNKIIGIDLGSYFSCVSVIEGGTPKVISNAEGNSTTPSCVAFTKEGIKVGQAALRQAALNPKNTIFNVKRLMGRSYAECKDIKMPYEIVNNHDRAAIKVDYEDGKIYSPEEISAMILQNLKKTAENYLGETVERAVITCPAFYTSSQRESVKVAGEIAGFKVERVINEPTAAVLNIDSAANKKYAIFDAGGYTTDLSVVDVGDGVYEILGSEGDLELGGSLLDEEIVNLLVENFKKENGMDLKKDPAALQRLFDAAEKAKIELSASANSEINLPYITAIDNVPKHLTYTLTKAKFEQIISKYVERFINIAKLAVKKSGVKYEDINEVVLVGGSTRIPVLQQKLEETFGKKLNKSLNADTCVAEGAAIQGSVLTGDSDILLLDVLPISLGLRTLGDVMTVMVEENVTIPCKKEETFSTSSDNQSAVTLDIAQGNRTNFNDNKKIGTFNLDGIMPAPRGVPQITVVFDVDANGILSVTASDKGTGKSQNIRIEGSTALSKEEIAKMKEDAIANADADKKFKETIEKLNSADSLIFNTEKQMNDFGDKLTPEYKETLMKDLTPLKEAVSAKEIDKLEGLIKNLSETWGKISTEIYSNIQEDVPAEATVVDATDVTDEAK